MRGHLTFPIFVVFLSCCSLANAAIVELAPADDDWASKGTGDTDEFVLMDQAGGLLVVGIKSIAERQAALEFDLSSIPTGSVILSANLSLDTLVVRASDAQLDVSIHGYAGDGVVTLADFGVDNVLSGGPYTIGEDGEDISADVSNEVALRFGASGDYVGFLLTPEVTGEIFAVFGSVSYNIPTFRPVLTVEYGDARVPEPSTLAIWGLLGICCIGYGWRRRRS